MICDLSYELSCFWLVFASEASQKWLDHTIGQIADETGKHPVDAMLDIVVNENLETEFFSMPPNGKLEYLKEIVDNPYVLFGVLLLPPALQILHLANGHMDENFFYDNDLNFHTDNEPCLLEYTFNNQLSDLKKKYSSKVSIESFSKIEINEIIFYSKNYFCLNDQRGPPSYMISSKV